GCEKTCRPSMMQGGHQSEPVNSIKSNFFSERARACAVSKFVSQVASAAGGGSVLGASFVRSQAPHTIPIASQVMRRPLEFINFIRSTVFLSLAIMDDPDFIQGDEAATHHFVKEWEQRLHFVVRIYYLNDDRQIHREPKNLGGMYATGRAESHRTAQDSGTGKMKFPCLKDDRFV